MPKDKCYDKIHNSVWLRRAGSEELKLIINLIVWDPGYSGGECWLYSYFCYKMVQPK